MHKPKPEKCKCGGIIKFSKITRSISCNKCFKAFKPDEGNKQNA